jgi:hypothetical protein
MVAGVLDGNGDWRAGIYVHERDEYVERLVGNAYELASTQTR